MRCGQHIDDDNECEDVAYRCQCAAINLEPERGRTALCGQCLKCVHLCGDGVYPLSRFYKGQRCGCGETPVSESDDSDDE